MTKQDEEWLQMKRQEMQKAKEIFGEHLRMWDTPKFLAIIADKDRELRRLKTMLAAKA